jgi:hypothetical protein
MSLSLLFTVLIALLVAGFLCWLVGVLPFLQQPLKQIVQGVILFCALLWLLYTVYDALAGGGASLHHRPFSS